MNVIIPERNKKAGLYYAVTLDGIELPVIDVTHPEFEVVWSEEAFEAERTAFYLQEKRRAWTPMFIRRIAFRFYARKSILARGLLGASNKFLSGLDTYLLKLGPSNLGQGYATVVDRYIAASFAVKLVRLRMQNTARLLALGLSGPLAEKPGTSLHLLNIAGGPAADSFNALLILQKEFPGSLTDRKIRIRVLDLKNEAPEFGRRALEALGAIGAPLQGIDVTLEHVNYDWREPRVLREELEIFESGKGLVAVSTEGGLFEYGSDNDIVANLEILGDHAPAGTFVVGSVTRDDEQDRRMIRANRIPIRPRGLPVFSALALRAGWSVEKAVERPFSDVVRLARRP
jgi:hypothetical protein